MMAAESVEHSVSQVRQACGRPAGTWMKPVPRPIASSLQLAQHVAFAASQKQVSEDQV